MILNKLWIFITNFFKINTSYFIYTLSWGLALIILTALTTSLTLWTALYTFPKVPKLNIIQITIPNWRFDDYVIITNFPHSLFDQIISSQLKFLYILWSRRITTWCPTTHINNLYESVEICPFKEYRKSKSFWETQKGPQQSSLHWKTLCGGFEKQSTSISSIPR